MQRAYKIYFTLMMLLIPACVRDSTHTNVSIPWDLSAREYELAYSILVSRETFSVSSYKSTDELHRSVELSLGPRMTQIDTNQYGSYVDMTFNLDMWLTNMTERNRVKVIDRWMHRYGDTLWLYKYRDAHQIQVSGADLEQSVYLRSFLELK